MLLSFQFIILFFSFPTGGTEIILSSISDAISHFMKNPLYKDLMLMAPFGFVKETS